MIRYEYHIRYVLTLWSKIKRARAILISPYLVDESHFAKIFCIIGIGIMRI